MNTQTLLIIIGAVLASPFLGILATNVFSKRKIGAETHNLNITGELSLSEGWQKYASQQQKDKEELRTEFSKKIEDLKYEHKKEISEMKEEFALITSAKNERISTLETKVEAQQLIITQLQAQIDYK